MEEFRSKLCLVDLAGSERAHDTGLTGVGLEEGIAINQSLSALGHLGDVVCALILFGGFWLFELYFISAFVPSYYHIVIYSIYRYIYRYIIYYPCLVMFITFIYLYPSFSSCLCLPGDGFPTFSQQGNAWFNFAKVNVWITVTNWPSCWQKVWVEMLWQWWSQPSHLQTLTTTTRCPHSVAGCRTSSSIMFHHLTQGCHSSWPINSRSQIHSDSNFWCCLSS